VFFVGSALFVKCGALLLHNLLGFGENPNPNTQLFVRYLSFAFFLTLAKTRYSHYQQCLDVF